MHKLKCKMGHLFYVQTDYISKYIESGEEICILCNEYKSSKGEEDVYEYVRSVYNGEIRRNDRKIAEPFEVDMVMDEIGVCIDFNVDDWHSDGIRDETYHIKKMSACLLSGYHLIQVREHDWNNRREFIQNKLKNLLNGIILEEDYNISGDILTVDLSWYDERLPKREGYQIIETTPPKKVKVGMVTQWDCGTKIYKIR